MTAAIRVAALGECMVELTEDGDDRFRLGFAGDVYNTAVYLRRLLPESAEVRFLTATGDDWLSERQLARMRGEGLVVDATRIAGASPALYLVQTDDEGERTFTYYREQSPVRHLLGPLWESRITEDLGRASLIYFSAITLQLLTEAARERLWDLLEEARAAGARIAFDSNYRARGWASPAAALAAVERAARVTDIALPSLSDELGFDPTATPRSVVERYRAAGASEVVLKDGTGPVGGFADGRALDVPVAPRRALDTTGAGDSFDAGYLAARLAGRSAEASVATAIELAAAVVQQRGAIVAPEVTARLRLD